MASWRGVARWRIAIALPLATRFYEVRYYGVRMCTSGSVKLRPYQQECVDACIDALERKHLTRIGISAPTGSGKTTMFLELVSRIFSREANTSHALILVNGITLAQQAAERAKRMFPHMTVDMDQGARHVASGVADITVATVQTLRQPKRLAKYNPHKFKCVIVDEAHHSTSPSYLSVLSHFHKAIVPSNKHGSTTDATTPIIGFSATFTRHDGVALGLVFEEIVFHKDFLDMIDEQWLCPVRFTLIRADFDLSKVSTTSSDYVVSSLAHVVNRPDVNELVVRSWMDLAGATRQSTLVFAVDVAHVHALVKEFQVRGIDARGIHASMRLTERESLLASFQRADFPVLINCGTFLQQS